MYTHVDLVTRERTNPRVPLALRISPDVYHGMKMREKWIEQAGTGKARRARGSKDPSLPIDGQFASSRGARTKDNVGGQTTASPCQPSGLCTKDRRGGGACDACPRRESTARSKRWRRLYALQY